MDMTLKKRIRKQSIRRFCRNMQILAMSLAAAVCPLMSAAAAEEQESEAVRPEEITLNYWIWDDEKYYMQKVVDAFEMTHPGIQIDLHVLENYIYDEQIGAIIRSEEQVDLIGIRGMTVIMDYQKAGLLLELNDYLAKSPLDTTAYGNMFGSCAMDGRYYGLPTRCTCWVLYYNKELFDEAGIDYPGQMTWEEYAELAKQMTWEREDGRKVWGGYFPNWCYQFAGIQRQKYLYDDDISETLEGLRMLNRFFNVDRSHTPLSQMLEIEDEYIRFFESGSVAMMPQGEWSAGLMLEYQKNGEMSVDWDIAPIPVFEGQKPYSSWGQYQFCGITAECRHPQEAFEFLSWLCGEEGARIIAGSGMISGYTNEEIEEIYRDSLKNKNADVFFRSQRVLENPLRPEYHELLNSFTDIAEAYLLQTISYEDAVAKIEAKRRELYAQE